MGPWYRAVACVPAAPRSARSPTWRARAAGKPPSNATSPSGPNSTSSWSSWPAGSPKDVAAEGRRAVRVGVKVRFAPFFTHTRSLTLPPTTSAEDVTASARVLLDRFEPGRPVRLLGVRADIDRAR
jgi:DNA polymerase-4